MTSQTGAFVSVSHVHVDPAGADTLEAAFRDRLGAVEDSPGFQRLEVWRDRSAPGRYVMVTWWDDASDLPDYLRSESHDRSHARVPTTPHRPRGAGLDRYDVIAR